jgi:S1-C subfamily serine protease
LIAAAAAAIAGIAAVGVVVGTAAPDGRTGPAGLPSVAVVADSSATLSTSAIYDQVDPAIVDIDTTVDGGAAAGTGMVLTSTGLVLTNNHVIAGATSIDVRIAGTGPTYTAHVVGYDVTDDVAVIQLDDASGLATITVGDPGSLRVGDGVVAIGNALGAEGPHAVTAGTVAALDQTVTADTDIPGEAETLDGLIQSTATLQPGDSGGALVGSNGAVIGMNTIGTVSGRRFGASSAGGGYAIPIDDALTIARQIVAGQASATVHIGERAILGIQVGGEGDGSGVTVAGVQDDGPAAASGLREGDTITAIGDASVGTLADLQQALNDRAPGDRVAVTWTTSAGQSKTATVTLVAGPPA